MGKYRAQETLNPSAARPGSGPSVGGAPTAPPPRRLIQRARKPALRRRRTRFLRVDGPRSPLAHREAKAGQCGRGERDTRQ